MNGEESTDRVRHYAIRWVSKVYELAAGYLFLTGFGILMAVVLELGWRYLFGGSLIPFALPLYYVFGLAVLVMAAGYALSAAGIYFGIIPEESYNEA